ELAAPHRPRARGAVLAGPSGGRGAPLGGRRDLPGPRSTRSSARRPGRGHSPAPRSRQRPVPARRPPRPSFAQPHGRRAPVRAVPRARAQRTPRRRGAQLAPFLPTRRLLPTGRVLPAGRRHVIPTEVYEQSVRGFFAPVGAYLDD